MDVDPVRKFIWDVGNGTSEASLCNTLEAFFHTLCPLANIFDEEICKDYKKAYEARCSPNAHRLAQEGTFLYVAIVLVFCLGMASLLKAKRILYVPDSAVTIVVGLFTGTIFYVSSANHRFNEQVFFEILLPFIIFEAGYNMDKQLLSQNFRIIMSLAVLGTFLSFAATTGIMVLGNKLLDRGWSDLDCAMFGALISSTDPIAIVNVFSSLGVNPRLYALVLGESALNDGVAVALYSSMKHFYTHPETQDSEALVYMLWNFLFISVGSVLLGFLFAVGTAYFWKIRGRAWFTHPVLETLIFLLSAILPYYVADAVKWSGVIAIVAGSMTLSVYAHCNLSATARIHVVFVVECIARLCEAVMFGYVGTQIVVNNTHMVWSDLVFVALLAVLIARAVAVFPILAISNLITTRCGANKDKVAVQQSVIPLNQQIVIWFSGLRGALSFALAVTVPEYDTVLKQGSKHFGEMLACTCFVIVMNVFVMGGLAPCVLRRAHVVVVLPEAGTTTDHDGNQAGRFQPDRRSLVGRIHSAYMVPWFVLASNGGADQQTGRDISMLSHHQSPLSGDVGREDPTPDENGFIHVVYDDEPPVDHAFIFPRSRIALSEQQRAAAMNSPGVTHGEGIRPSNHDNSMVDALLNAVTEDDDESGR